MIIWKGLGFLGALIPFIFIVMSNSFLGSEVVGWAILTSAVPVWLLGRNFYRRPAEMMVDPKNQQNVLAKPAHTLFGVGLDYWAIMLVIFGIPFLLPEHLTNVSMRIAIVFMVLIFLGRLGFILYHKYIKIDDSEKNYSSNQPGPTVIAENNKGDKLSRFAAKSSNKKMGMTAASTIEKTITQDSGLTKSELKKKAYYTEMRKAREAPKKFGASNHSNYIPGGMPFIPTTSIMGKDTVMEEEE